MIIKVDLTDLQAREVALAWIKDQQDKPAGYVPVLNALLAGAQFAEWSWIDALRYGVRLCCKAYAFRQNQVLAALNCNGENPPC